MILPLVLAGATLLLLTFLAPNDAQLTMELAEVSPTWQSIAQIFDQSGFENEPWGVSDLAIGLYILVLLLWCSQQWFQRHAPYRQQHATNSWWLPLQQPSPYLRRSVRFILLNGLCTGILMVHTIKLLWGRARPKVVLQQGQEYYTDWYHKGVFQPFVDQYSGSFPSGHTAACLIYFAIGLCFYHVPLDSKGWRLLGVATMVFGLIMAVAMGFSRSMVMMHWITDWVFSIGIGGTITLLLFRQLMPPNPHKTS